MIKFPFGSYSYISTKDGASLCRRHATIRAARGGKSIERLLFPYPGAGFSPQKKQPEIQGSCVIPSAVYGLPSLDHAQHKKTHKREITHRAGTHRRNTQLRAKI
jgi:hypothetical protein